MARKKFVDEVTESKEDFNKILLKAVYNRDFKMVQWALKMGADVDTRDEDGRTALIIACDYKASKEPILKFSTVQGVD